jgi:hypothetical protein
MKPWKRIRSWTGPFAAATMARAICGCTMGTRCADMQFVTLRPADRVVITTNMNETLRTISDPTSVAALVSFAEAHTSSWEVPWYGPRGSIVRANFYAGNRFLGLCSARSAPWLDSWREITTQSGLHIRRQTIEALSREHDWPGGQADLPLGALGRKGAPGLEVELLGEMYRQQPDGFQQSRCRDGQLDGRQFIHPRSTVARVCRIGFSRAMTSHR